MNQKELKNTLMVIKTVWSLWFMRKYFSALRVNWAIITRYLINFTDKRDHSSFNLFYQKVKFQIFGVKYVCLIISDLTNMSIYVGPMQYRG